MSGKDIHHILADLSSLRAENAWKAFLRIYSPTIMLVVRHYEGDNTRADECFLFVCEKLAENNFRRLLQFDKDRKAQFSTWLKLVVSHLCVDWHRKAYGRQRPYRAITRLSAFDQLVYHFNTECGMDRGECFQALKVKYPDITEEQLAQSMSRLHSNLTPKQRWRLSMRKRETGSAVMVDALDEQSTEAELTEKSAGPETLAEMSQAREMLARAMSRLSHQQRLILRLRYQENLSLKDVADLAGLGDLHKARRRIKQALMELAELLKFDKPVS